MLSDEAFSVAEPAVVTGTDTEVAGDTAVVLISFSSVVAGAGAVVAGAGDVVVTGTGTAVVTGVSSEVSPFQFTTIL